MNTLYMKSAYRGVPYELHYDHLTQWENVDPKSVDANNGIFMCYCYDDRKGWEHINYGEKQEKACHKGIDSAIKNNIKKLIKNLKKEMGAKEWNALIKKGDSPRRYRL